MTSSISPFSYPFDKTDIEFVTNSIKSVMENRDFLTMGKFGEELETLFSKKFNLSHSIAVNSGTAALEIGLQCLDISGAEIIVPSNTFTASVTPIIKNGATPVFAECDGNGIIDPVDVEKLISPKTKAVMAVHIGGYISPTTTRLAELCKERGIPLIEDAAHAIGATLNGRTAGQFGDMAAFSFFSTKVLTSGEGGMLVVNNDSIAKKARVIRNHGQDIDNVVDLPGQNSRMHEFIAILALSQLEKIDHLINRRREIAKIYDRHIGQYRLQGSAHEGSNFYKYILSLPKGIDQEDVIKRIKRKYNITMGGFVYPIPCHMQKVFSNLSKRSLPKTERFCKTHICPPIYPDLTDEDAMRICEAILEEFSGYENVDG